MVEIVEAGSEPQVATDALLDALVAELRRVGRALARAAREDAARATG